VLLPFVAVYGYNTPYHAIALGFALVSLIFAYKIALKYLKDERYAAFFALFLVLGTNYLHLSLWGAVWYLAQNMAFAFMLVSFYFAVTDNKKHSIISLFALCAAMGCRPFNAVYLPLIFYLLYRRGGGSLLPFVKRLFVYAVPAIALGTFFAWLNFARFGNIFEFGHNYLPEFVLDYHGQFHQSRIPRNLGMMFFERDIFFQIREGFPFVERTSFAFWLASPIVVSYVVYLFFRVQNDEKKEATLWLIPLLVLLHLFAFSFHRTLGGRQFGSRYAADSLPAIYMGLMFILSKMHLNDKTMLYNAIPFAFGKLINFHGTIMFLDFYF
jgi:hypothetical protein